MERKDFFTQDFYERPELTLNILNELVKTKQVADMDMYLSGEFLFMEVYENDDTKRLLAQVISDLEAYKTYNNANYVSDETTQIGLCALEDEHNHVFKRTGKVIMWDAGQEEFVHEEDFDFERNKYLHGL